MPPKVKYAKEEIIRAALDVVRGGGEAALNARAIADRLGCSTQPLYRELRNMEEIRQAVLNKAQKLYAARVTESAGLAETPYKSAGIAFLRFANEEKELFKLLFMRDRSGQRQDTETSDPGLAYALSAIEAAYGFTPAQSREFHLHMSIYTHGLGVMVATNYTDFDEKAFSDALSAEFRALRLLFSQGRED